MTEKPTKRMTRAILCGCLGVLLLSISVAAAYGSASGYGKYKDGVTELITDTDNATVQFTEYTRYDGEIKDQSAMVYRVDGKNHSSHEKSAFAERFYSVVDGNVQEFYGDDSTYSVYKSDEYDYNPMGFDQNSDKLIKFCSLLADTVLGDLKNNVVLVSESNGLKNYTMDIKSEQIPPVINAGLDLVMANSSYGGYTIYEDEEAVIASYYEKKYGTAVPDSFRQYLDTMYSDDAGETLDEDADELYWELYEEMDAGYTDLLQNASDPNSAVVYIHADGTYTLYDTYSDYALAEDEATDINDFLGKKAVLNGVVFNFSIDDKDRLVSNDCTVTFASTDSAGVEHTVEYILKLKVSDYGSTVVRHFNVGSRTEEPLEDETVPGEAEGAVVEFEEAPAAEPSEGV